MKRNNLVGIVLIIILIIIAWQTKMFGLFTLSPITINPSTCISPTLISEKAVLSSELSKPCYPTSYQYPTIIVAYDGKSGNYLNSISGDSSLWGATNKLSTTIRCYKCSSAQIIGSSSTTKILNQNIIPNPLAQSVYCASVCIPGSCEGGWECKKQGDCNYFEYTACDNAPSNPPRFCGNNICESGETKDNCCTDCGCLTGTCKSNACQEIENEENVSNDICGDGVCSNTEDCSKCSQDCGKCNCFSNSDCYANSSNYCTKYTCEKYQCQEMGVRFEGCCTIDSSCKSGEKCIDHLCQKPKPTSPINLIITFLIIAGIGVGGYFAYKKIKK